MYALLALACVWPGQAGSANQQGKTATTSQAALTAPAKSSLKIEDVKLGTGPKVTNFDQVTVDYTGTLENGQKFDSSIGRAPFSFIVGIGQVIPGWEQGLIGMQVGGTRKLTIPAELAYGAAGAGDGLIPPNATLKFTIELHKISQPIKELTIKTEVAGTGDPIKVGDEIGFEFVGSQKDGTLFAQDNPPSPLAKVVFGKSPVFAGLTLGLAGMKLGEIRSIIIPPDLGFGDQAKGNLPANSTLYFRVALCSLGTQTAKDRPVLKPFTVAPADSTKSATSKTDGKSSPTTGSTGAGQATGSGSTQSTGGDKGKGN